MNENTNNFDAPKYETFIIRYQYGNIGNMPIFQAIDHISKMCMVWSRIPVLVFTRARSIFLNIF